MSIRAGRITGNPVDGLCERMCIETKRVFDGCSIIERNASFVANLNIDSNIFTPPYTFNSITNMGQSTLTVLSVSPVCGNRMNVVGDIAIPLFCSFTDSQGRRGCANGTLMLQKSVILAVPNESLVPYEVESFVSLAGDNGAFLNDSTINFVGCIVIIFKVTARVDILIPSYGYCVYPPCRSCGNICDRLDNISLFPEIINT